MSTNLRIYRYSACTTCKKALKWLDENKINYQVIDSNGHVKETLDDSIDFKNTIGDILVEIIEEQMEAGNLAYND